MKDARDAPIVKFWADTSAVVYLFVLGLILPCVPGKQINLHYRSYSAFHHTIFE